MRQAERVQKALFMGSLLKYVDNRAKNAITFVCFIEVVSL